MSEKKEKKTCEDCHFWNDRCTHEISGEILDDITPPGFKRCVHWKKRKKEKNCLNCQRYHLTHDGLKCHLFKVIDGKDSRNRKIDNPETHSCDQRMRDVSWKEIFDLKYKWQDEAVDNIKGFKKETRCDECYHHYPITEEFEEAHQKTKPDDMDIDDWWPLFLKVVEEERFKWCGEHERMVPGGGCCPKFREPEVM